MVRILALASAHTPHFSNVSALLDGSVDAAEAGEATPTLWVEKIGGRRAARCFISFVCHDWSKYYVSGAILKLIFLWLILF